MRKITICHNGFHGWIRADINVKSSQIERPDYLEDDLVIIRLTDSQIRRLRKVACPGGDCKCGESMLTPLVGTEYNEHPTYVVYCTASELNAGQINQWGNYPQ